MWRIIIKVFQYLSTNHIGVMCWHVFYWNHHHWSSTGDTWNIEIDIALILTQIMSWHLLWCYVNTIIYISRTKLVIFFCKNKLIIFSIYIVTNKKLYYNRSIIINFIYIYMYYKFLKYIFFKFNYKYTNFYYF